MIIFQLFWAFLQVGMFSIGGGYAAMPIIQSQVVSHYHWISMDEFADLVIIAEMTPGPIAINAATFTGMRVLGIPGAIIATMGCIFPSCFIASLLAFLYYRYKKMAGMQTIMACIRPAVVALISSAGLSILINALGANGVNIRNIDFSGLNWLNAILFLIAFLLIRIWKKKPILIMLGCGIAYTVVSLCI